MGIDNICFLVFFSKTQMAQGKELPAVEIFAEIYFFRFWTRKVMKFAELIFVIRSFHEKFAEFIFVIETSQ